MPRLPARETRALAASCRVPGPGGRRWPRRRAAVLRLPGTPGCRFLAVASRFRHGSLKALIKNPPPSLRPGGEQRPMEGAGAGACGWRACQPVPAVLRVPSPSPGSRARSRSSPARRSGGPRGQPPSPHQQALPGCSRRCRAVPPTWTEAVSEGRRAAGPCLGTPAGLGSPSPEHTDGDAAGCEVLAAVPGRGVTVAAPRASRRVTRCPRC